MNIEEQDAIEEDKKPSQEAQPEQVEKAEEKKEKRSFRKGKKSKEKDRIVELEQELGEAKDKYLRLFAEFDNYKKRSFTVRFL